MHVEIALENAAQINQILLQAYPAGASALTFNSLLSILENGNRLLSHLGFDLIFDGNVEASYQGPEYQTPREEQVALQLVRTSEYDDIIKWYLVAVTYPGSHPGPPRHHWRQWEFYFDAHYVADLVEVLLCNARHPLNWSGSSLVRLLDRLQIDTNLAEVGSACWDVLRQHATASDLIRAVDRLGGLLCSLGPNPALENAIDHLRMVLALSGVPHQPPPRP